MRASVRSGLPARQLTSLLVVLVVALGSLVATSTPSHAEVTSVTGSAFGYHGYNLSLFGRSQPEQGPTPQVQLASDAFNSPQTATADSGQVTTDGPAIFTSGPIAAETEGSLGAAGSVTSTTSIDNINPTGNEVFTADNLSSSCTASETATTGSTTVTSGTLATHAQASDHPEGVESIPTNPGADYAVEGHLHIGSTTDYFVYVFNEQTVDADGTLTINAVHAHYGAQLDSEGNIVDHPESNLQGELVLGQVVCGVTATATTTTTTAPTTTTTAPTTTTTTTAPTTTTTRTNARTAGSGSGTNTSGTNTSGTNTSNGDGSATTAGVSQVAGSAYGYFVDASLGQDLTIQEGPAPFVELAPDASNSPQDDSLGSAEVTLGPATLFASGQIDVHTEGAIGEGWYVESSADVQGPAEPLDPFHFDAASSSCRAEEGGTSGTTTITGGQVVSVSGTQPVPTNPDPNTSFTGTVPGAGDEFRITFNEQITEDGTLTVNAAHLELLGPIATGDVIIGQSVCGGAGGTGDGGGGDADTTGQAGSTNGGADQLASTGTDPRPLTALSAVLMILGLAMIRGARRRSAAPGLDGPGR